MLVGGSISVVFEVAAHDFVEEGSCYVFDLALLAVSSRVHADEGFLGW